MKVIFLLLVYGITLMSCDTVNLFIADQYDLDSPLRDFGTPFWYADSYNWPFWYDYPFNWRYDYW